MQAVQNERLHVSEIVFYKLGTIQLANGTNLTAKNPCIVMITMTGNIVKQIAVSDPTQKLQSLQFQLTVPLTTSRNNWKTTWNKEGKFSLIEVNLPTAGEAGKSVVMEITDKTKQEQ